MTSIKKIAVIGSGQMGAGIGLLSASYGYEVVFNDIKQEFIDGGLSNNKKWLDRQVSKGKLVQSKADEIYGKMSGELSIEKSVSNADLVIEAIIENLDIKRSTWEKIGKAAPDHAIFGSNTSSLSITEMAKASGRPDKFVGIHFFNPPIILKIIEYIKGYETSENTLQVAIEYGKSMEMNTVTANETPGFIVNRLMIPQLNESYYALMQGVATKEDIDTAMKFGLNHPMGPLTLSDFIGLDTILFITEYLYSELGEKFRPCPLLRKMVRAGKLGRKTGEGFYKYN
ncbi:MAG: 3-hydroxyacyl-CoA dehydrogenase family protein [Candidatus Kariarchaeaceae archaeon]